MKIGIIGAMEPEVALLKEQMTIERTYYQARMMFLLLLYSRELARLMQQHARRS